MGLSALASAIGGSKAFNSIISATTSSILQNSANAKAKRQAAAQRNWEEQMSNTAHQREVDDLKAAGLNPILSALGGNGASTPSVGIADANNIADLNSALDFAVSSQQADAQTKTANSNAELNEHLAQKADAEKTEIEERTGTITPTAKSVIRKNDSETAKNESEIRKIELENKFEQETYSHRITQKFAQIEKDISESRISIDNAKFLSQYGITKEQAIQLGVAGIHEIGNLIKEGADILTVNKKMNEILKLNRNINSKLNTKHSAKH